MIIEAASFHRSTLDSPVLRIFSVAIRIVAVLLFIALIALVFLGLSTVVGNIAFFLAGASYGQEAMVIVGAVIMIMLIPMLFLFDRILAKLLMRFGFSWTVFGHKW